MNLKEWFVDLDFIIDRFIEKDVFFLEYWEKIEYVSLVILQKKFNEFIQFLLVLFEFNMYFVFLEVLIEERYYYMVEWLQNIVISGKLCIVCSYIDIQSVIKCILYVCVGLQIGWGLEDLDFYFIF